MGGDPKLQDLALSAEVIQLREQLAAHEANARSTNILIGCMVKRLGQAHADGSGMRVIVTDEEMQSLEGGLEVWRSEGAQGIVLTLHTPKPTVTEVAETEGT